MTYLFAVLAAIVNAGASVLQRKVNRDQPAEDSLSLRLIADLVRKPAWFLGVCGVIGGFLLQAAALGSGPLSVVEPILILELPATLLLAGLVFGGRLHRREWLSAAAVTLGLGALLFVLSPSAEGGAHATALRWTIGIATNLVVIAALVNRGRRGKSAHRAAFLGVAAGASFGMTASLIKAMMTAFADRGIVAVFVTWQTYALVATGLLGMFLLQSSLNAGRLVAAQPGITAADPAVSVLWGIFAFGEHVRGGLYVLPAVIAAAAIGAGIVGLARSPLVGAGEREGSGRAGNDSDTHRTHHG